MFIFILFLKKKKKCTQSNNSKIKHRKFLLSWKVSNYQSILNLINQSLTNKEISINKRLILPNNFIYILLFLSVVHVTMLFGIRYLSKNTCGRYDHFQFHRLDKPQSGKSDKFSHHARYIHFIHRTDEFLAKIAEYFHNQHDHAAD